MADVQSNIQVNLDATQALAQLKSLQAQLAQFNNSIATTNKAAARAQANLNSNLINSINATGKFQASITSIKSSTDAFTDSLERNKFSTREYFRYAGGATKSFGRLFKTEFNTIGKVAEERVKTMQTQYIKMGRDANGAIKAIAVRPLALDMDNLATKTALAAQKQQLLNQLLKQGSTNLLNFGKNTQWAGRQLMVGFTVPLSMLAVSAGKTFMALEKQAIRFKRVYGEMFTTTDETAKALKEVELLAKQFTKYGVAVEKTMEIAADAAATGKMGADLIAQVKEATRLAVLGGVEQQQALETTISLTNAFGIAADELRGKIDFLNAVENQTVLNIEDLTIAIPKAAPVIRQLGGDVEDLAFFMTAMKEGGINASEGANALKSGLASLINPSKKASAFLADFGVNIKAIVESNKGDIKSTVIQFAQALDTLDPLNRARAIEQLFGKFQFSRLSTLFQNITKDGTQASRTLNLASNSVEELAILSERELKKVEDATGTKFKKTMEDLKVTLAPIGEQFLKAVTPIVEFIGKILEKFNGLSDGVKSGIVKFIGVVGLIGPAMLMTFGLVANGVANIIKLFVTLRKGFMNLGGQSKILGNQTQYMTSEQVEATTVAASLDQAHSRLRQTFLLEAQAANQLTAAYQRGMVAANNFAKTNPGMMKPGFTPRKFSQGGDVPGTGNTDTVPAMLTPGEFVVNKKAAKENRGLLQGLNSGGYALRGVGTTMVNGYDRSLPRMRPGSIEYAKALVAKRKAQQTFLGMPSKNAGKAQERQTRQLELDKIATETYKSPRARTMLVTNPGERISPSTGRSFPSSSVGGVYRKPNGDMVFVKPMPSEKAALAEMRATEIARDVHGLVSPQQKLTLIADPNDPTGHRRYFALESKVDPRIANVPQEFTKEQTIKQLVASTLRGDKDLAPGNIGGNVIADVGPAGVFSRASGMKTEYAKQMPSMEEQAMINLLGVNGGARKFFAQSTAPIAAKMSPIEYDRLIKKEINEILPKLKTKIGSMNLTPEELPVYEAMIARLQSGSKTDWTKFQPIHAAALNKGGFVKRNEGDPWTIKPGGVAGTALLHFEDAHGGMAPTHTDGRLEGFRKSAGYTMIGDQGYNQLTQGQKGLGLPEPYPLTYEDAIEADKKLQDHVNKTKQNYENATTEKQKEKAFKQYRNAIVASEQLKGDISTIVGNARGNTARSAWSNSMATRVALAAALSEGQDMGGPVFKKVFAEFNKVAASGKNTKTISAQYKTVVDKMWKDGFFGDQGMSTGGRKNQTGKGTLHSRLKVPLSKSIQKVAGYDAIKSLLNVTQTGKQKSFVQNAVTKALMGKGFRVKKNGSPQYGEPETVPALLTPGEFIASPALAQQVGPALQYINSGGKIEKRSKGTIVPGTGNKDTVPMILNKGSFVVNKQSTEENKGFLQKLNKGGFVLRGDGNPFDNIGVYDPDQLETITPDMTPEQRQHTEERNRKIARRVRTTKVINKIDAVLEKTSIGERHRAEQQQEEDEIKRENQRAIDEVKDKEKIQKAERDLQKSKNKIRQLDRRIAEAKASGDKERGTALRAERATVVQERKNAGTALNSARQLAKERRENAAVVSQERGKQKSPSRVGRFVSRAKTPFPRVQKMAGPAGALGMAASMGLGMTGNMGGSMLAMGLGMAPQLMSTPVGAITTAIVGVAAGYIYLKKKNEALAVKTMETTEAMGASSKSLNELAIFTNKVTGTELMNRKKANSFSRFEIQPGKTTFGQSYVQSETGQKKIKEITNSVKTSGKVDAQNSIASQLATSIASGVLTASQAQSIAAELGKQLNDYSFGINVNSKLISLMGPNGENALKDPIGIRVKLIDTARDNVAASLSGVQNAKNAKLGLFNGAAIAKATGTAVGLQSIAIQQSQELLNSFDAQTQKEIEQLEIKNKLAEADELRTKRAKERLILVEKDKEIAQQSIKFFDDVFMSSSKTATSLLRTSEKGAISAYKGTAEQDIAGGAVESIKGFEGITRSQQYAINLQLKGKNVSPTEILNLSSLFKGDKEGTQKLLNVLVSSPAQTNEASQVASMFMNKSGEPLKEVQKSLVLKMTQGGSEQNQKNIEFFKTIGKTGTVIDLEVVTTYLEKYPGVAENLQNIFAQIQKTKGKITMSVLSKIDGLSIDETEALKGQMEYLNTLDPNQQKIFTITFLSNYGAMQNDVAALSSYLNSTGMSARAIEAQLSTAAGKAKAAEGASAAAATQVTKQQEAFAAEQQAAAADEAEKGRNSLIDEMMKKLKLFHDSTIKATGGFNELMKAMTTKKPIIPIDFDGTISRLRKLGKGKVSEDYLDFVKNLTNQELEDKNLMKKMGITTKKKKGGGLEVASIDMATQQKFQAGMVSAEIGSNYDDTIKALKEMENRTNAINILRRKGFSEQEANNVVTTDAIALAITQGKIAKEDLDRIKTGQKSLSQATFEYNRFTKTAQMDAAESQSKQLQMARAYIELQEKMIENEYVKEKTMLNIQQGDNDYALELVSRQEEKINESYDKQITALEEINRLRERENELTSKRMSIAAAFASGDMASAARAMQDYREARVSQNARTRMEALQKAKENAIKGVTAPDGRSRTEIEKSNQSIEQRRVDIENEIRVKKIELDKLTQEKMKLTKDQIDAAISTINLAVEALGPEAAKAYLKNIFTVLNGDAKTAKDTVIELNNDLDAFLKRMDAARIAAVGIKSGNVIVDPNPSGSSTGGGTPPVVTPPSSGSSTGYVAIGSTFIPVTNNLPPKKAPAKKATALPDYLRAIPGFKFGMGGMVPKYFANGGFNKGTDTVPAMLTPGEFVVNRKATQQFGPLLSEINSPTFKTPRSATPNFAGINSPNNITSTNNSKTLYNYNLNVNVSNSNANPNDIARTVINQIRQIDNQRIRSL